MKTLVVLTGAGISTESGLPTYRGKEGLWEGHRLEEIATPMAFERNPEQVLRFYNQRRRQLETVQPNAGHLALSRLEEKFRVLVITQNVDDLHERAGSTSILHLHGQLKQGRSSLDPEVVVDLEDDIRLGDLAPDGTQLRPNVVWFHEPVYMMDQAVELTRQADIFLVSGTSLVVYPAASLLDFVPGHAPIYMVDPVLPEMARRHPRVHGRQGPASTELPKLAEELLQGVVQV